MHGLLEGSSEALRCIYLQVSMYRHGTSLSRLDLPCAFRHGHVLCK